jgi:hypothetical protein
MESASFMTREEMRKLASDMNVIGQTNSIVNGLLAIEHSFACSSSTSNPKNSFSSSLMDNDDIFQILDFGCYDGRYSLKAIDPIVKKVSYSPSTSRSLSENYDTISRTLFMKFKYFFILSIVLSHINNIITLVDIITLSKIP